MDLAELQRELQALEGGAAVASSTLPQNAQHPRSSGLSESRVETPPRGGNGRKDSLNHVEAAAAVAAAAQRLQLWQQQSLKVESRVAAMQRKQQAEEEAATRRLRFDHAMRSQAENAARHARALQSFAATVDASSYTASRAGSANVSFGRGVSASPSAALSEFVLDELGLPRDLNTGAISVAHVQQAPVYGGPLMLRRQGAGAGNSAGSSGEVTTPLFFVPGSSGAAQPQTSSSVGFYSEPAAGSPTLGVRASGLFDTTINEGHSPNPRGTTSSVIMGTPVMGLPAPAPVASGGRIPLRHRAHQLDPHTQRRVADAWRDTIIGLQGHLADVTAVNATQASTHHSRFVRSAATPEPSSGPFALTMPAGAPDVSAPTAAPPLGRPASYTPGPGAAATHDRPPMHLTWNGRSSNGASTAGATTSQQQQQQQQLQLDAALEVKATRRLVELMRREEAEGRRREMIRAGGVAPDDTLRAVDTPECGSTVVGDAHQMARIEPLGVVTMRVVPTEELRTQVVASVSEPVQPVLLTAAANDRRAYVSALQAIRGESTADATAAAADADKAAALGSESSEGGVAAVSHGIPGAATGGLDAAVAIARDSRLAIRRAAQRREVEALRQQIAELEEEVLLGSAVSVLQRVGRGARTRLRRLPALVAAAKERAAAAAAGEREEVAELLATIVNAQSSAAAAATPPGTPSVGTSCAVSEADEAGVARSTRATSSVAAERVRRVSLLDMDDASASTTTPATSETASPSRRTRTPVPLAPSSARSQQEAAAQQMRAEAEATMLEAQRNVAAVASAPSTGAAAAAPTLSQLLELRARLQQLVDGNLAERQAADRAVDGGILAPLEATLEQVQSAIIKMLEARKAVGADLLRTLQREARETRHVARAARHVQAFFRMVHQRNRYRVLLRDERERVAALSALAVLQRHQAAAATRIQSAWRGHRARLVAASRRRFKNRYGPRRCVADAASSAIAWAYRRYLLRDAPQREDPICAVQELQAATVLIQAKWRSAVARAQFRLAVGGDLDAWRAQAHRKGAAAVIRKAWNAHAARKAAVADVSVRRVEAGRRHSESLILMAEQQIHAGLVISPASTRKLVRLSARGQAPTASTHAATDSSSVVVASDAESAVVAAERHAAARIIQRGGKARLARRELEALRVAAAVTLQRQEAATTVGKAIDSARSQIASMHSTRKALASTTARTASARAATRRAGASAVVAGAVESAALASARRVAGVVHRDGGASANMDDEFAKSRQEEAARVIQRAMRAGLGRSQESRLATASEVADGWRRDVVREEAVVQIQAAWRGARTRADAAAALEARERDTAHVIADEAATMIQSAARGFLVRRDL